MTRQELRTTFLRKHVKKRVFLLILTLLAVLILEIGNYLYAMNRYGYVPIGGIVVISAGALIMIVTQIRGFITILNFLKALVANIKYDEDTKVYSQEIQFKLFGIDYSKTNVHVIKQNQIRINNITHSYLGEVKEIHDKLSGKSFYLIEEYLD